METKTQEKSLLNDGDISVTEEWTVVCSDDETYSSSTKINGRLIWEPSPAEIIQMYQTLESKGILDMEWQCPGRRSPSVHSNESESVDKRPLDDDDNTKLLEPNEFDFDDEVSSETATPKIAPRRRGTPANSAQKRVARLDKVMFDIRRYRKMDELELQKIPSANKNKPIHRVPSSSTLENV